MATGAPITATRSGMGRHGPASDLLLGAGVAYLLSVPLVFLVAWRFDVAGWPFMVLWIITIGLNSPHYGATLVRVYQRGEERRKYAFFSTWVTLGLAGLFVAGLHDAWLASLLLTLYFTWSPWHFAGQNYGVALMFLRRSGVAVEPRAKRLLYASFVLSFLLSFLALHVRGSETSYAPTGTSDAAGLDLLRLGIPENLALALMVVLGAVYLGCLAASGVLLRREATPRQLVPVACLVLCQALWFAVPAAFDLAGAWSVRPLAFWAIWISAAHSLQYLWVTLHYEKRIDVTTRLRSYMIRTTLVGNAVIVLPSSLVTPGLLGGSSWNLGVAMLIFSVVNLHHFILDGAVWKLRDGRVARALLQDTAEPAPIGPPSRRPAWMAAAFWAVTLLCLAVSVAELGWRQAEQLGAWRAAGATLDGLGWFGREHEVARIRIGRQLVELGDFAAARHQFERSLAVRPSANAWGGLGRSYEAQGELESALDAYRAGLAIDPHNPGLARRIGALAEGMPE